MVGLGIISDTIGLGIIRDTSRVYVFPKVNEKDYYCLWWGLKVEKTYRLNKSFCFTSDQTLQGPQELTAWLD